MPGYSLPLTSLALCSPTPRPTDSLNPDEAPFFWHKYILPDILCFLNLPNSVSRHNFKDWAVFRSLETGCHCLH